MTVQSLSPAGLRFLEGWEGFREHLYNDASGYATIGYGHLVHYGAVGSNPVKEAPFTGGLAKAPAAMLLARDAAKAEAAVRTWCGEHGLQQHEFDALVSFAFNVGAGALMRSTLARRVNSCATPDAILDAFMMWVKPKSLTSRRRAEAELYLRGNYGGFVS